MGVTGCSSIAKWLRVRALGECIRSRHNLLSPSLLGLAVKMSLLVVLYLLAGRVRFGTVSCPVVLSSLEKSIWSRHNLLSPGLLSL